MVGKPLSRLGDRAKHVGERMKIAHPRAENGPSGEHDKAGGEVAKRMARKVRVKRVSHGGRSVNIDLTGRQANRLISRISAKVGQKARRELVRVTIWPSGTFSVMIVPAK